MAQAIVYKSTGSWYTLKNRAGAMFNARLKGVFKLDELTSTNPIAVGDVVDYEMENETEGSVTITNIHDRRNYINRQSPRHKHQHHIIASNLDQSLLVATLKDPRTSRGFMDRFLAACEMYHVPAVVVFNKADVHRKKELELYSELEKIYTAIGYTILLMSIRENRGITEVAEKLQGKVTLISGHSGVGKSSFINAVVPHQHLRTRDVSGWSGKGMHTTTFAEMFDLPAGGKLIDTPGMREFGLVDVERHELSGYFPEMRKRLHGCRFNNCLHMNEQDCAIKEAVNSGDIDVDRYVSYCSILESLEEKTY